MCCWFGGPFFEVFDIRGKKFHNEDLGDPVVYEDHNREWLIMKRGFWINVNSCTGMFDYFGRVTPWWTFTSLRNITIFLIRKSTKNCHVQRQTASLPQAIPIQFPRDGMKTGNSLWRVAVNGPPGSAAAGQPGSCAFQSAKLGRCFRLVKVRPGTWPRIGLSSGTQTKLMLMIFHYNK